MSTGPITPSDLVLYRSPKGVVKVGVLVRDETVWLTQKALSELFAVGVPAIAKHLKNIFESAELEAAATVSSLETVRREASRDMGLTTWKHALRGKVTKSDVSIAKNYLNEEELRELEEIVSAYLDLAENATIFTEATTILTQGAPALAIHHTFGVPLAVVAEPREWHALRRRPEIAEHDAKLGRVLVRFSAIGHFGSFGGTCLYALREGSWGCYVIKPSAEASLASAEAWLNKRSWQGW